MVRSQRNHYDHAVRAAGLEIVEVGLPDRYAGAGCRDAEPWEIADAISDAHGRPVLYVADAARGRRSTVVASPTPRRAGDRRRRGAAAARSAICGASSPSAPIWSPSAAARRSAARRPPASSAAGATSSSPPRCRSSTSTTPRADGRPRRRLIDKAGSRRAAARHRPPCKVGKEQIVGLLTALELFVAEGDAARHGAGWRASRRSPIASATCPGSRSTCAVTLPYPPWRWPQRAARRRRWRSTRRWSRAGRACMSIPKSWARAGWCSTRSAWRRTTCPA